MEAVHAIFWPAGLGVTPRNPRFVAPESGAADEPAPAADPVAGSQRAYLTLLFNKYRAPLHRYLAGLVGSNDDAAELVQESYFRLMRHLEVTQLEAIARSYLFQTATNLARDYHRRRAVRRPDLNVSIDEAADTLADTATPEQTLLWEESIGEIRAALREMPQELRDVFLLSRFRRKTYPEIAHMLGISSRTVERRMSQAMTLLAARLRGAP
jgi:RNA polymerase sigma-70 factor (ECF subfamily)